MGVLANIDFTVLKTINYGRKIGNAFVILVFFIFTALGTISVAQACPAGYTCFDDFPNPNDLTRSTIGKVAGYNSRWSALPGGWDNRADFFINFGRTHNFRMFRDNDYKGPSKSLRRGHSVFWWNTVSSNNWFR